MLSLSVDPSASVDVLISIGGFIPISVDLQIPVGLHFTWDRYMPSLIYSLTFFFSTSVDQLLQFTPLSGYQLTNYLVNK